MAEALVSIVLEQLGSIIVRELEQEVRLVVGVRKEVKSLTDTLTIIQGVLKDAEEKQVKDGALKFWLAQLKDISYNVGDILDEWSTRINISKSQPQDVNAPAWKQGAILFVLSFSMYHTYSHIGTKIRELNEQLDGTARKNDMYKLIEGRSLEEQRPISSSFVDVSEICGRIDDKEVIANKLLSESSHNNSHVPVISIVGTGGFGKTTLARLILKDENIITNFEKHMWVCVSDPPNLEKVAQEIIQEAQGYASNIVGWQALLKSLSKSVQGKRFILVLDDVWVYDGFQWNK